MITTEQPDDDADPRKPDMITLSNDFFVSATVGLLLGALLIVFAGGSKPLIDGADGERKEDEAAIAAQNPSKELLSSEEKEKVVEKFKKHKKLSELTKKLGMSDDDIRFQCVPILWTIFYQLISGNRWTTQISRMWTH